MNSVTSHQTPNHLPATQTMYIAILHAFPIVSLTVTHIWGIIDPLPTMHTAVAHPNDPIPVFPNHSCAYAMLALWGMGPMPFFSLTCSVPLYMGRCFWFP